MTPDVRLTIGDEFKTWKNSDELQTCKGFKLALETVVKVKERASFPETRDNEVADWLPIFLWPRFSENDEFNKALAEADHLESELQLAPRSGRNKPDQTTPLAELAIVLTIYFYRFGRTARKHLSVRITCLEGTCLNNGIVSLNWREIA